MGHTNEKVMDDDLSRDYWTFEQLSRMTGATESQIKRNVSGNHLRSLHRNGQRYVLREDFIRWVSGQPHYFLEDEETMARQIRSSVSLPEFARMLDVNYDTARNILNSLNGKRLLKTFWIANRIRITKASVFRWLVEDSRFGAAKQERPEKLPDFTKLGKYLTDEEAAYLSGLSVSRLADLRRKGEFPSVRLSYHVVRIPLDGFLPWLFRRKEKESTERSQRGRFQRQLMQEEGLINGQHST